MAHSPDQRVVPAPKQGIRVRQSAKAVPKGFCVVIFLKLDRDDDKFTVLPVGEPYGLEHVLVEPRPQFEHFMGEIRPTQCDRDRVHARLTSLSALNLLGAPTSAPSLS